jgi:hypothetical protein
VLTAAAIRRKQELGEFMADNDNPRDPGATQLGRHRCQTFPLFEQRGRRTL